MKTFSNRLKDFISSHNFKTDDDFAKFIGESNANISRVINGKTKAPKITLLQNIALKCKMAPIDLYELITGETYSEVSNDPIIEENARLKERIAEQKDEIAFLRGLLNNHAAPVININVDKDKEGAEGRSEGGEPQVRGKAVDSTAPL